MTEAVPEPQTLRPVACYPQGPRQGMAKIYLHEEGQTELWLDATRAAGGPFIADAVGLVAGTVTSGFVLANAPEIQDLLPADRDGGGDRRLATWDEPVEHATVAAKRHAADSLDSLHDMLRSLAIKHDLSTSRADFLGMAAVAGATLTCTLGLNPPGLLAADAEPAPLLDAEAPARVALQESIF